MVKKKRQSKPRRSGRALRETELMLEASNLQSWSKNLQGCLNFLIQLKQVKTKDPSKWVTGNASYYLKRVETLLDNVPKGAEGVAKKARPVLAQLKTVLK